jgi:hypothetical protein
MGLDLYVDTLTRYHTGAWETEAQRVGREAGFPVQVIYANGRPRRLMKLIAPILIERWRRRLVRKVAHVVQNDLSWSESKSKPYWARKPDHDGRHALVLAGAYAERPELPRPRNIPETAEADRAYAAASKHYLQSIVAVLECHMFLPSADMFLTAAPDAVGVDRVVTTTASLAWALGSINQALWQADDTQITQWATRGPISTRTMTFEAGRITGEQEEPSVDNAFEHTAQFGFAIYSEALKFAQIHDLPILTDE